MKQAQWRELLAAKNELSGRLLPRSARHPRDYTVSRRIADALAHAGTRVHAVGVGRKIVAGAATTTPSVRVYVTQKLPMGLLSETARIPPVIDGMDTDVVEAPAAFFAAASPCSLHRRDRARPVLAGVSGASAKIAAGTLGALCFSLREGEAHKRFVLGNCHTLADFGNVPLGAPIVQPSIQDGGTAHDIIAHLHRYVAIQTDPEHRNAVDAAIAELMDGVPMDEQICSIGSVAGLAAPVDRMEVLKHGRTTGLTVGVIDDAAVDVSVPLSRGDWSASAVFRNQIRIRATVANSLFAQFGDSGSLVVNRRTRKAVGLLFACPESGGFAYANPIRAVLEALQIRLG